LKWIHSESLGSFSESLGSFFDFSRSFFMATGSPVPAKAGAYMFEGGGCRTTAGGFETAAGAKKQFDKLQVPLYNHFTAWTYTQFSILAKNGIIGAAADGVLMGDPP
jgi:hypothetical protein